jgi:hypothetical protein
LLGGNTQCSHFFGGKGSLRVLDELVIHLNTSLINDSRIGMRMSGSFSNLVTEQEGIAYRLFERAEVNSKGAFYHSKAFSSEMPVPNVGSFSAEHERSKSAHSAP